MGKKSATETQTLERSCTSVKKDLEGGGFTCKNKDGKWVTCIPNDDTTSTCWITKESPQTDVLDAFVQVREALQVVETALDKVISPAPEY